MTQPDGYIPDGAVSSSGLASFAAKTQADWQADQRASVQSNFSNAQTGFAKILGDVPIVGDVMEIVTGVPDADPNDFGSFINNIKNAVEKAAADIGAFIFGVGGTVVKDVTDFVTNTWSNVKQGWDSFWDGVFGTNNQIGSTPATVRTAANVVSSRANTAASTATTAAVTANSAVIFTGNLQASLVSGHTVVTVTSNSSWTVPTGLSEIYVAIIGAGAKGADGTASSSVSVQGGLGGAGGTAIAVEINPSTLTEGSLITCTIGSGSSTTPSDTTFGSILSSDDSYRGFVATPLGLILTASNGSNGGNGGSYYTTGGGPAATSGGNTSAGLAGGSAGSGTAGASGGSGNEGLNFGLCQTGGSGGGGGALRYQSAGTGGSGGSGGFPGGGGGGGGAHYKTGGGATAGTGGNGGNGVILIIYKTATT